MTALLAKLTKKNQKSEKSVGERLASIETDLTWIKWFILVGVPIIVVQLFRIMERLPPPPN